MIWSTLQISSHWSRRISFEVPNIWINSSYCLISGLLLANCLAAWFTQMSLIWFQWFAIKCFWYLNFIYNWMASSLHFIQISIGIQCHFSTILLFVYIIQWAKINSYLLCRIFYRSIFACRTRRFGQNGRLHCRFNPWIQRCRIEECTNHSRTCRHRQANCKTNSPRSSCTNRPQSRLHTCSSIG